MAWLEGLPFSNGRVGMYGFSYPGHTQLQIAVRKPPRCCEDSEGLVKVANPATRAGSDINHLNRRAQRSG